MRRHAAQRVRQLNLADFIHSFHVGQRVLWEATLSLATDDDSRRAALGLVTPIARYFDVAIIHAAEVYLEAEQLLGEAGERARRDALESLLAASALEPAASKVVRDAGLSERTECLVIAATQVGADTDQHTLRAAASSLSRTSRRTDAPLTVVRRGEIVIVTPVRTQGHRVAHRADPRGVRPTRRTGTRARRWCEHRPSRPRWRRGRVPRGRRGPRSSRRRTRGRRATDHASARLPGAQLQSYCSAADLCRHRAVRRGRRRARRRAARDPARLRRSRHERQARVADPARARQHRPLQACPYRRTYGCGHAQPRRPGRTACRCPDLGSGTETKPNPREPSGPDLRARNRWPSHRSRSYPRQFRARWRGALCPAVSRWGRALQGLSAGGVRASRR